MKNLLPLLTIDIEASTRPAGSHPELVDAGDVNDIGETYCGKCGGPFPICKLCNQPFLCQCNGTELCSCVNSPLPFHLTEADLAPRRVAPVNDFSAIPGDSELRDLARVTPDELRK